MMLMSLSSFFSLLLIFPYVLLHTHFYIHNYFGYVMRIIIDRDLASEYQTFVDAHLSYVSGPVLLPIVCTLDDC